jgi:CheY-like chemotaxis protein
MNALDAIEGVGRVSIEASNVALDADFCARRSGLAPGDHVALSIKDSGKGMNPKVLERLFEPFFTTKDVGHGTGLGLAMIYGILQQNKGFIEVQSHPGHGSAFTIYFPRYAKGSTETPLPEVNDVPKGGGECVLLVEDEPAALRMAESMIQNLGYRVLAAGTPSEALRLAEEKKDDVRLLLTDIIMPDMNGRELSGKIKKIIPGIKHLYMSGYSGDILGRHGVSEKGITLLRKPFTEKDLASALHATLRGL